ncbi:MAG: hypothetical protein J6R82_03925 [Clostridia bacterium]|nr:hypothetical protein [Clostridia bacterium]
MNNTFVTETDPQYVRKLFIKGMIISFFAFSLIACLGFLVAWQTFVWFELVVIFSWVVALVLCQKKGNHWTLEFKGDVLTITNIKTNASYCVYDIPASDFMIKQSKRDVQLDYCTFLIKNTVFAMDGVKNCQQLKAYIQENYK